MKIAFTMIHYPVAMGRYILEALYRRQDVELWTAGPFTGRWIPWAGGMHLPESYLRQPDYPIPFGNPPNVVYEILQNKCPFEPDAWIEVNAGLKTIGRPDGLYAVIGTDPHVLDYSASRECADTFFCMQTPYMQTGDEWLPYAHDPVWHAPSDIDYEDRVHDGALIGLQYEKRNSLVKTLRGKGYDIFYELGIAYEDARAVYHNTKIGLNWSSLEDTTARVFELMGMMTVPLVNRVPDLEHLFEENEHYLGFSSQAEAISQFDWAMNNPDKAKQIAHNAMDAVQTHTWDHRVDHVLRTIGLIE